ncbi:heavy-metal-associated domain-containing protein [Indiicoccus explosivorum]|uniref:heavy-metal-associated domain-containing protein n=1 Tax=Indiicoccus explosivorum TaxID=1917864 RepID=UPI000B44D89B|nr:heavy metal-associated domain-containing protein [Indiicoccus explosivorum]
METATFTIKNIPGERAIETLDKKLLDAPGVERALVDVEEERVTVEYDRERISEEQLVLRIKEHGCEIVE